MPIWFKCLILAVFSFSLGFTVHGEDKWVAVCECLDTADAIIRNTGCKSGDGDSAAKAQLRALGSCQQVYTSSFQPSKMLGNCTLEKNGQVVEPAKVIQCGQGF